VVFPFPLLGKFRGASLSSSFTILGYTVERYPLFFSFFCGPTVGVCLLASILGERGFSRVSLSLYYPPRLVGEGGPSYLQHLKPHTFYFTGGEARAPPASRKFPLVVDFADVIIPLTFRWFDDILAYGIESHWSDGVGASPPFCDNTPHLSPPAMTLTGDAKIVAYYEVSSRSFNTVCFARLL